ncbi:MAG TPA: tRNA pseudouridine(13) synthase TruD [Aquifex aeolicus]|nr:tRNA pseudouridine(13) synthase TruD [Aquifex aeolicus]
MDIRIKEKPEDFYVKEIKDLNLKDKGEFAFFLLRKKDMTTIDAIRHISRRFNIPLKNISFAGLKDKKAITEQYISIKGLKSEVVERLGNYQAENLSLRFLGFSDKGTELGEIEGNYFEITVRGITRRHRAVFSYMKDLVSEFGCENYFGEQRFGSVKHAKEFVIKHLLKHDYEEAMKEYLTSLKNKRLKKMLIKAWRDWERFLELMPKGSTPETEVIQALKRGESFKNAFMVLPKNVRLMFAFAYQSYLWNRYLHTFIVRYLRYCRTPFIKWELAFFNEMSERIWKEIEDIEISYLGLDYPPKNKKIEIIIKEVLKEEKITYKMLMAERIGIKLFSDGVRKAFFKPVDLKVIEDKGKTMKLAFTLPPGSYATVLLRKLFCSNIKSLT